MFKSSRNQNTGVLVKDMRELAEWSIAVSLKLIWLIKPHPFESDILCIHSQIVRVRARLVRRLIWVEEQLCSNHNNPIILLNSLVFISNVYDM